MLEKRVRQGWQYYGRIGAVLGGLIWIVAVGRVCSTVGRVTFDADVMSQYADLREEVIAHELLHLQVPNHLLIVAQRTEAPGLITGTRLQPAHDSYSDTSNV
jgi:hypothetical protein